MAKCTLLFQVFTLLYYIYNTPSLRAGNIESKQQRATEQNPVYLSAHDKGYGRETYQPYYVCESDDDNSGMSLPAWHYSCKESCMSNHLKQQINITGARWNYIGPDIDVYKVVTNEVCYTSHENVWGYCSHTQSTRPVKTTIEDKANLPSDVLSGKTIPKGGVHYITNSGYAECEYFSDNTKCARDYQVYRRAGKINKKTSESSPEMTIVIDGIRTNPDASSLELDDVAWFWDAPNPEQLKECGWETTNQISCSYTDTTDIIKCPDIGYTYNIQGLAKIDTCAGSIYDHDGPFPFFYASDQDIEAKEETYKRAKQGKADPDIAFIEGVGKAFQDLELTYCSATCDLFARQGSPDEDHVLDTPIGTWRYVNSNRGIPRLVPCLPTSSWKLNDPTTLCHGKDHVLVVDKKTGHPGSWDTKKDYIITGEVCNTDQSQIDEDSDDLRDKITRGEEINITFWTGDILSLKPPYDKPAWINSSVLFRQNPSWFSSVQISKDMLHTKSEVETMLTEMVSNATKEVLYKTSGDITMRKLLADEILGGIEGVSETIWKVMYGLFGGIAKVFILIICCIIVYIVISTTLKIRALLSVKNKVEKTVRFVAHEAPGADQILTTPVKLRMSDRRKAKSDLRELLSN
nr:glycoprotein [Paris yunnanensis betanucleorhabdovirus 1]